MFKSFAVLRRKPSELCFAVRWLRVESNVLSAVPGSASQAEGGERCHLKILFKAAPSVGRRQRAAHRRKQQLDFVSGLSRVIAEGNGEISRNNPG